MYILLRAIFLYICIEGVSFELSDGSHMYLFAIKLPFVNFPPSIHGTYVGHHVEYSLQGFLELNDTPGCIETACIPVIYLPFVTCMPMDGDVLREGAKKNQVFRRNNAVVEVIAEMIKPAYCPGKVKNNIFLLNFRSTRPLFFWPRFRSPKRNKKKI